MGRGIEGFRSRIACHVTRLCCDFIAHSARNIEGWSSNTWGGQTDTKCILEKLCSLYISRYSCSFHAGTWHCVENSLCFWNIVYFLNVLCHFSVYSCSVLSGSATGDPLSSRGLLFFWQTFALTASAFMRLGVSMHVFFFRCSTWSPHHPFILPRWGILAGASWPCRPSGSGFHVTKRAISR